MIAIVWLHTDIDQGYHWQGACIPCLGCHTIFGLAYHIWSVRIYGSLFNIKMLSHQYRKSHCDYKWFYNHLISMVGFRTTVRQQLYIHFEWGPCSYMLSINVCKEKSSYSGICIIGCTGNCENDNFLCRQSWKYYQYDCIPISICFNFNTLRLRQNVCQFPDDIFKCIFLNENM